MATTVIFRSRLVCRFHTSQKGIKASAISIVTLKAVIAAQEVALQKVSQGAYRGLT